MAKISEHTIEQVRSHADIVDVVSEFVDLKKKGRNFFGLCPFHGEKTASFSVSQEKQIYHCFGCGAGGGSIHFIMEIEKLEFVDAIKYLADKLGIAIQFDQQSRGRQIISQLEDIHHIAVEHFQSNLASTEGKSVLTHLQKRGLNTSTIEKFNSTLRKYPEANYFLKLYTPTNIDDYFMSYFKENTPNILNIIYFKPADVANYHYQHNCTTEFTKHVK